jgi:hypothetical protein
MLADRPKLGLHQRQRSSFVQLEERRRRKGGLDLLERSAPTISIAWLASWPERPCGQMS